VHLLGRKEFILIEMRGKTTIKSIQYVDELMGDEFAQQPMNYALTYLPGNTA
jgi:hypothetical protein